MADSETYRKDCPKCGAPLAPVALGPETAPYLCYGCGLGFFAAELTDASRARYRPRHHDWGQGTPATTLRTVVFGESIEANARGTSLRHDQISSTHVEVLKSIVSHPRVHPEFAAVIAAEIEARVA